MNLVAITDIFGNKIVKRDDNNNFLPFILIHSNQPHLILKRVSSRDDSVWKLNKSAISHILYTNSISEKRFAPLGHIWLPRKTLPNKIKILLVNTEAIISKYPIKYIKLGAYNNKYIWKPIGPRDYMAIGFVISKQSPVLREVKTVNRDLITLFRGRTVHNNSVGNMNEFNLLSYIDEKKYTVKRTPLLRSNNVLKLMSKLSQRYITEDSDTVSLRSKDSNYNQKINYTTQGELKLNDKCIGISMNDNMSDNFVYIDRCDDSDGQKWYPYRDTFISQFDQSCLTENNGTVTTEKCDGEKENQKWRMENIERVVEDKLQETNDRWSTQSGKKVILIESDNPWYINKTNKPEGIFIDRRVELNKKDYGPGKFHSTFMMDVHNPSMGYGYSQEQRKGTQCSCMEDCHKMSDSVRFPVLENFDGGVKKSNFNKIACSLLSVIVLLVIVRLYVNNKE